MEDEKDILFDYRELIINNSNDEEIKTKWFSNPDPIFRTLLYELSQFGDVESEKYDKCYDVRKKAFELYCPNYENEYKTADVMNGWWCCFKRVCNDSGFNLGSRRDEETKQKIKLILEKKLKGIKEDVLESMQLFFRVVYTIGNLTPSPINPGVGYEGKSDYWEHKLDRWKGLYHDYKGDRKKLFFQDYPQESRSFEDEKEYMDTRVDLILKRGFRILNNGERITQEELDYLKSKIKQECLAPSSVS